MVALIFCDVTVDLLALVTAITTGMVASGTFVGALIALIGNAILTVAAVPTLVASGVAVVPAALLFLTAFGITFPVVFHI